MPKHISKLTKTQKEKMPEFAQNWIDIGLKTGDTDWDTFDKYMPICYQKAGLVYPDNVVRVESPLVGAMAASIAREILKYSAVGSAVDSAVGSAVGSAVDSAVGSAVGSAVLSAVLSAVDSAVDSAVLSAVDSAVDSAVRSAVDSAVRSAVRSAVDSAVRSAVGFIKGNISWHYWIGGQFWVGGWWGSPTYVAYLTDVCNLKLSSDMTERADAYRKICESVNYIWPNQNFVIVCARPTKIDRDSRGRLHSITGKAIEYPDGWGLYMINGVRFEDEKLWQIISDGTISALDVFAIKNMEQRRIAYELMDKSKISDLDGLVEVDRVDNDGCGYHMRIIQFTQPDIPEPFRYLNCFCPTSGREYYLETQETDCWKAKSASFGLGDVEWIAEY